MPPKSYRPINAATQFNLVDSDKWKFPLGAGGGGLLPAGDQPGAFDFSNLALSRKFNVPDFPVPLSTGLDATFNYGKQDPSTPIPRYVRRTYAPHLFRYREIRPGIL